MKISNKKIIKILVGCLSVCSAFSVSTKAMKATESQQKQTKNEKSNDNSINDMTTSLNDINNISNNDMTTNLSNNNKNNKKNKNKRKNKQKDQKHVEENNIKLSNTDINFISNQDKITDKNINNVETKKDQNEIKENDNNNNFNIINTKTEQNKTKEEFNNNINEKAPLEQETYLDENKLKITPPITKNFNSTDYKYIRDWIYDFNASFENDHCKIKAGDNIEISMKNFEKDMNDSLKILDKSANKSNFKPNIYDYIYKFLNKAQKLLDYAEKIRKLTASLYSETSKKFTFKQMLLSFDKNVENFSEVLKSLKEKFKEIDGKYVDLSKFETSNKLLKNVDIINNFENFIARILNHRINLIRAKVSDKPNAIGKEKVIKQIDNIPDVEISNFDAIKPLLKDFDMSISADKEHKKICTGENSCGKEKINKMQVFTRLLNNSTKSLEEESKKYKNPTKAKEAILQEIKKCENFKTRYGDFLEGNKKCGAAFQERINDTITIINYIIDKYFKINQKSLNVYDKNFPQVFQISKRDFEEIAAIKSILQNPPSKEINFKEISIYLEEIQSKIVKSIDLMEYSRESFVINTINSLPELEIKYGNLEEKYDIQSIREVTLSLIKKFNDSLKLLKEKNNEIKSIKKGAKNFIPTKPQLTDDEEKIISKINKLPIKDVSLCRKEILNYVVELACNAQSYNKLYNAQKLETKQSESNIDLQNLFNLKHLIKQIESLSINCEAIAYILKNKECDLYMKDKENLQNFIATLKVVKNANELLKEIENSKPLDSLNIAKYVFTNK